MMMDSLCKINDSLDEELEFAIELGQSFVQPKYLGLCTLDYLWQGIGVYLSHNPHIKYILRISYIKIFFKRFWHYCTYPL